MLNLPIVNVKFDIFLLVGFIHWNILPVLFQLMNLNYLKDFIEKP